MTALRIKTLRAVSLTDLFQGYAALIEAFHAQRENFTFGYGDCQHSCIAPRRVALALAGQPPFAPIVERLESLDPTTLIDLES